MSDDRSLRAELDADDYLRQSGECYACIVGVATGPESHSEWCQVRTIPMPEQDGKWGPEWDEYDYLCRLRRGEVA